MKDTLKFGNKLEIETIYGELVVQWAGLSNKEALIVSSKINLNKVQRVRIQSSCVFSESLHSIDCDCADQLSGALLNIGKKGGILIYLFDEGRGIGLKNKIEAIIIQKSLNASTADAFSKLGFEKDERKFDLAIHILKELFHNQDIDLITNNPLKVELLRSKGIKVRRRIKSIFVKNEKVKTYLLEKVDVLDHIIEF